MRSIFAGGRSSPWIVAACVVAISVGVPNAVRAADCGKLIRVRVYTGSGPLKIAAGALQHRIEIGERGLRVDAGAAGQRWRSARKDAWQIGKLQVKGVLEARRTKRGFTIVNEVGLEDYVVGVLGGEIPALWADAALRAQAVVSRTYALHQSRARSGADYDVEATTTSQVYLGTRAAPSIETAVAETRCEYLSHRGEPILAVFHSASGGRTASSEEVWGRHLAYLRSQVVEGEDDSPDTFWRTQLSATTLGAALAAAGHELDWVDKARVLRRSDSGRVSEIQLRGTFRDGPGTVTLSGRALRSALGESTLKSTLFELKQDKDAFIFIGTGRGHGVGMSQWGARAMARQGRDYREILGVFYPGTRIERWRGAALRRSRQVARASEGSQL
jgi:stage II sporulation protein D